MSKSRPWLPEVLAFRAWLHAGIFVNKPRIFKKLSTLSEGEAQ